MTPESGVTFIKLITYSLPASVIITVMTLIIKGYFIQVNTRIKDTGVSLNKRLDDIKSDFDARLNDYQRKTDEVLSKTHDVYEMVLKKFSAYEDRINSILDKVLNQSLEITSGKYDQVEIDRLHSSIKQIDKETKEDISAINVKVVEVKKGVENLRTIVKETKTIEYKKDENLLESVNTRFKSVNAELTRVEKNLKDMQSLVNDKISRNASMVQQVYKIIAALHAETKSLNFRVNNLQESRLSQKVTLFKGKK